MPSRARARSSPSHRHVFVACRRALDEPVAADRAEVALDVHAEHLLELLAQMARHEMQGLLMDRATFDGVDRREAFESALEPLHERALARADRAHEVEDLFRLFAPHRRRVEIAHDLFERALHPEELFFEKAEDLHGPVAEHALCARVRLEVEIAHPSRHEHVIHALVRKVGLARIGFHLLQILQEGPLPVGPLSFEPIPLDQGSEVDLLILHASAPLAHLGWTAARYLPHPPHRYIKASTTVLAK